MCNLDRLRELTYRLVDLATPGCDGNCVVYDVGDGNCFGLNILLQQDVSIQRVFAQKGTTFPRYSHGSRAWLIVYHGKVVIEVDGHDHILGVGDYVTCDPGQPRTGTALEDTWLIAVSVPAADGYPG